MANLRKVKELVLETYSTAVKKHYTWKTSTILYEVLEIFTTLSNTFFKSFSRVCSNCGNISFSFA